MRKESEGVTETLLESAEREFLKYGFRDASLRRISSESGVSTNSIYTRFKDKEGLFEALVKPAADGLMNIYMNSVELYLFIDRQLSHMLHAKTSVSSRNIIDNIIIYEQRHL